MSSAFDIVLRQAQLPDHSVADVGISDGRFAAIEPKLGRCDDDIDCRGKLLLPGLHDHHIHLLATAARAQSVELSGCADANAIVTALRAKASEIESGEWVRAVGYDERIAGMPDRHMLDTWLADRPLRLQDRTGALWVLNSAGVALIGTAHWPDSVERDANGESTGRIWRGDDWLRQQIGNDPPSLGPLSQQLARWGVTAVTDAGANNGPDEAAILSAALRSGALRQKLFLMGREDLPESCDYLLGPVKLLFDERALPALDCIVACIKVARTLGRRVAAHCVTEAELLTYLAALEHAGGAWKGDRIEHGSLISQSLIADIADARLTVVANPGFIARRGDRYLAEMDPVDLPNLHRLRTLLIEEVTVLGGSDAPYGPANPWVAIRGAMFREIPSKVVLGASERLSAGAALALFASGRSIQVGEVADCCVADKDWAAQLREVGEPNPVQFTVIGGELT